MFVEEYTTIDKSEWPAGVWQDEVDKAVWVDETTGLDCMIHRGPHGGHLCGYVGVPEGHPWFEVDYDDVRCGDEDQSWPSVNGGLTYAGFCHQRDDPSVGICHIPQAGRPDRVWWLGFDCAHAHDYSPGFARTYEKSGLHDYADEHYWTVDEVRRETERLARQAASCV